MPVQDEGHIPFDRLPKREIRDWIEDWLDLPGVNVLPPIPSAGGGTTIINNNSLDEVGWSRHVNAWAPVPWPGAAAAGFAIASSLTTRAYCQRIVPHGDLTIVGAEVAARVAGADAASWQVGIYNADGTTQIDRTDWRSISATSGNNEGVFTGATEAWVGGNVALSADTEYLIATIFRQDSGATAPSFMNWQSIGEYVSAFHPASATTATTVFENYLMFSGVRGAGTWTDLPADLAAVLDTALSATSAPLVLLHTA